MVKQICSFITDLNWDKNLRSASGISILPFLYQEFMRSVWSKTPWKSYRCWESIKFLVYPKWPQTFSADQYSPFREIWWSFPKVQQKYTRSTICQLISYKLLNQSEFTVLDKVWMPHNQWCCPCKFPFVPNSYLQVSVNTFCSWEYSKASCLDAKCLPNAWNWLKLATGTW